MQNADSLKGISKGTSPSGGIQNAVDVGWKADHQGKTDPKSVINDAYNKHPVDPQTVNK